MSGFGTFGPEHPVDKRPAPEQRDYVGEGSLGEPLDRKFRFVATCVEHDHQHSEHDALVWLAHDAALPFMLQAYRQECVRLGAEALQIRGIDALIERVRLWQARHPGKVKTPDLDPGFEHLAR